MKNFDTRVYSILDFVEWHNRDQLQLSPEFQRRSVWSLKAKSYLIDTIITGKPMPKLLITQNVQDRRNIRIVVDGQQRLRSIIEYVEGNFPVSRAHNKEFARMHFDELPEDVRTDFLKYEIGVDLLYDLPYTDILEIFARLNTYTVTLNRQELLNAKFVGFFKQIAYRLGYRYVHYLIDGGVLSKAQVTRMAEAQLTSDLLVAVTDGVQTSKNIEVHYKKYEDEFDSADRCEQQFDEVMVIVNAIYSPEELANTNWSRTHLFYTLFTTIGHALFGLRGLDEGVRPSLNSPNVARARVVLDDISERYDRYIKDRNVEAEAPRDFAEFMDRSRRATTDTAARVGRSNFVCEKLNETV